MPNLLPLSSKSGIARACVIAGGQAALAKKLNAGSGGTRPHVSQQAVSAWVRKGYVPADRLIEIVTCVSNRLMPIDLIDPDLRQVLESSLLSQGETHGK